MESLPNLLIVDDNKSNQDFLETAITKVNVNIIIASSGAEALEKAKMIDIALALIDVQMPEMNGYDLALQLNEKRQADKIPIIFLTANRITEKEELKGYMSGAVDYISKPIDYRILLRKINIFIDLFNHKQAIKNDAALLKKSAEELVYANLNLKKSEEKYRTIFENVHDVFYQIDLSGKILSISPSIKYHSAFEMDDILCTPAHNIYHDPNDRKIVVNALTQFGQIKDYEIKLKAKTGSIVHALLNARMVYDADGKPSHIDGALRDITKRKLAEEALKKSEEKYRMLINLAPDAFFQGDAVGNFLDVNNSAIELTGYSREELLTMHLKDILSLDYPDQNRLKLDLIEKGETVKIEREIIRKDGNKIYIEMNSKKMPDGTVQSFFRDITKRKLAEDALKKSEKNNRMLLNLAPDAFFQGNSKGFLIDVNNQATELTGYNQKELLSMNIKDLFLPEDLEENKLQYARLEENKSLKNERIVLRKDGGRIYVEMNSRKMPDGTYQSFFRDISERKKVENTLRTTKIVFDSSISANSIADMQGRLTEVNKSFISIWGYNNKNEVLGKTIRDFFNSEIEANNIRNSLLETGSWNGTFIAKKSDGSTFIAQCLAILLKDEAGRTIGYHSSVTDITTQRVAEEALLNSQARIRALVQSIPDMIWMKDTNGVYLACNKAMERYFGANESEIIGKTAYDFVSKEIADGFRDGDRVAIANGEPTHKEEWISYPNDNRTIFIDTIKTPLYDIRGELVGVLGIARDFTDRKMAEEALRKSEEKYKRMLKAAPASVLFIGVNGIINEVSGIDLELFGAKTREDIVGKHFLIFVAPEEKSVIRKVIKQTMTNGIAQDVELKLIKHDKTIYLSEINSSLITSQNGAILAFMVSVRDISQRKEIAAKQYHADRLASLGEISASLAHEINQPLNMIYMIIDKILFEYAKTDIIDIELLKKKSETIYKNISRVKKIINHVKGYSKSHNEVLSATFDINSSIENAVMIISSQFQDLGIRLDIQLSENLPGIIGNTYKFEQVMLNFLINARDAVMERKPNETQDYEMITSIKSYREDHEIIIEVSDDGIGIESENLKYILVPFYTSKGKNEGTGLGLPISYQIIKEMNGTIEITSERFYGTTVKIVFYI